MSAKVYLYLVMCCNGHGYRMTTQGDRISEECAGRECEKVGVHSIFSKEEDARDLVYTLRDEGYWYAYVLRKVLDLEYPHFPCDVGDANAIWFTTSNINKLRYL